MLLDVRKNLWEPFGKLVRGLLVRPTLDNGSSLLDKAATILHLIDVFGDSWFSELPPFLRTLEL